MPHKMLSQRSRQPLRTSLMVQIHTDRVVNDAYNAESNPKGYIGMSVAENHLSLEDLPLIQVRDIRENSSYQRVRGNIALLEPLARHLSRRVVQCPVEVEHLTVLAGGLAVMDALFHCLLDPNDAVLVPAPYYHSFNGPISARNLGVLVPVYFKPETNNVDESVAIDALETALQQARQSNQHKVRAVLISSPQNPSGGLYSRDALEKLIQWCEQSDLHLVVDEAYANCVFGREQKFVSAGKHVSDRVHVIYTISKDFGLAGLRLGVLYTKNHAINAQMEVKGMSSMCSALVQHAIARLLSQEEDVTAYCAKNSENLGRAYVAITQAIEEQGIRYVPASAGVFIMLDLRDHLHGVADEELFEDIVKSTNVGLSPGTTMGCDEPGWFRLIFAYHPVETTILAVRRLGEFLSKRAATGSKVVPVAKLAEQ